MSSADFDFLPHHSRSSSSSPSRSPSKMMRRRGSSIAYLAQEASTSSSHSSFTFTTDSELTKFRCPICRKKVDTISSSVFEDHIDHCRVSRSVSASFHQRRSSIDSDASDDSSPTTVTSATSLRAGRYPTSMLSRMASSPLPRPTYMCGEDVRFTLSTIGDAVEFGGFGVGEPLEGYGEDVADFLRPPPTMKRPRPVVRKAKIIPRPTLRRRLTVDIHTEDPLASPLT